MTWFYHALQQIEDMARERHRLESCVLEMNTRGREVEAWLSANQAKTPTGGPPAAHATLCLIPSQQRAQTANAACGPLQTRLTREGTTGVTLQTPPWTGSGHSAPRKHAGCLTIMTVRLQEKHSSVGNSLAKWNFIAAAAR